MFSDLVIAVTSRFSGGGRGRWHQEGGRPHAQRDSFAMALVERDVDIRVIQEADGRNLVNGQRVVKEPGQWLASYGD